MNIWFGQKRPCGSFLSSSSVGGPAPPLWRKINKCAVTSRTSSAGISQTCRPKKRLIVSVPIDGPPYANCCTMPPTSGVLCAIETATWRREVRVHVPRQQIAREPEHERHEQQRTPTTHDSSRGAL